MTHYNLPTGWILRKLREIAVIQPSKSEIRNFPDNLEVSFVPMSSVDEEKGEIVSSSRRPLDEVRTGFTFFKDDDILFAKITPCMENGKVAIAREMINGIGFGSTEFYVIRPHDPGLVEWIYFFLRRKSFRDLAQSCMTGTVGQQRVPKDFIENTSIPIAPDKTRIRIIQNIKRLMELISEAKSIQEQTLIEINALNHSVLDNAFRGRIFNP